MNVQNKPPHEEPRRIQVAPGDNVAIVVNSLGLPAGSTFPDGLVLNHFVPQGHKVALSDIADGGDVIRYNEVIGTAKGAILRGDWINEDNVVMGTAPPLDQLEMATRPPPKPEPLTGHTFEGYRNADGTVGTKNILAVSTSVQCVSGTGVPRACARGSTPAQAAMPRSSSSSLGGPLRVLQAASASGIRMTVVAAYSLSLPGRTSACRPGARWSMKSSSAYRLADSATVSKRP